MIEFWSGKLPAVGLVPGPKKKKKNLRQNKKNISKSFSTFFTEKIKYLYCALYICINIIYLLPKFFKIINQTCNARIHFKFSFYKGICILVNISTYYKNFC